jgi:hypothetical protein
MKLSSRGLEGAKSLAVGADGRRMSIKRTARVTREAAPTPSGVLLELGEPMELSLRRLPEGK